MVEKRYDWNEGAKLEEHSHRKHKVLREYFFDYLTVRCKLPQQERFRLAIVDGFAGGGRYQCGTPGSPLIFIEELKRASESVNAQRTAHGLSAIEIECLLILNDESAAAIELLKTHVAPAQVEVAQTTPKLHLRIEYLNQAFESAYPNIKGLLERGRYRSVVFNLDQCGHSHVERTTIVDIMRTYPSAEIFYTFMISSLLAFLQRTEPDRLRTQLAYLNLSQLDLQNLDSSIVSNNGWLGAAERIVFEAFRMCAPFVSPFSINNPNGWRYWLIHFANVYRARQVYNNVLHENSSLQAHFGRSGLNMLSYDPSHDGKLYLFDMSGRASAKNQLADDIPRLVMESGDAMPVSDFYESIYNITPAHTDDVHSAIIENPDLEVVTPSGGERRKANTIAVNDVLKIKTQRSFFPLFLNANSARRK
ncbi:MAG: three-Cys-motif partner protein TcmP [Enhydrobacter sp.]|nr:MAG: three-Cys-motif partner protein TcmP [Enhydrobacter sp.]